MPARSSNPVFNQKTFDRFSNLTDQASGGRMTMRGTLDRATILFAIAAGSAALAWVVISSTPVLALPAVMGGVVVAFIVALITSFNPTVAPYTSPVYALFEGVALGAMSRILEQRYPGIAAEAMVGTGAIFGVMLFLYRFRVIRATPTFKRVVISMTAAVAVMYLVATVMWLFGLHVPLINDPSVPGIALSLFLIGLASMNLIIDFDLIENGEQTGQPKFMEWYAAFGLLVTVAWIYIEVLRLLNKLRR